MDCAAARAHPFPYFKVFHLRVFVSAAAAPLAGREPSVNLQEMFAHALHFVFHECKELSPSRPEEISFDSL